MRIIVALDGTTASEAAIAATSQHTWPEASQIKLLYVLNDKKGKSVFGKLKGDSPEQCLEQTKSGIEEITRRLQERMNSLNISYEICHGDPKSEINKFAKQWRADLVVVGTKNKKGIDALLLGSVSKSVLQKSDCPVLIVKNGLMANHIKHGEDFTRILIASDGKESSKSAFAWLAKQTWSDEVVFKVMSVIPQEDSQIAKAGDAQKAAWMLRQWSTIKDKVMKGMNKDALLLGKGLNNEYISVDVVPGNPKEKIVDIAKGWRAELIVTGAEPKSHLDKIFAGSVSQAIASKAGCSVLVVKGLDKNGERLSDKAKDKVGEDKAYLSEPAKTRRPVNPPDNDNNPPFKMF